MEKTQPLSQTLSLTTSFPSFPFGQNSPQNPALSRDFNIEMISSLDDVFDAIHYAIEKNQCIYWVRNTVEDAQEAFKALSKQSWLSEEKLTLLHGRFTVEDRQRVEESLLECFGEKSSHEDRAGRVFIGTYVTEKSLNLDFDWVITDLAPVEHIFQHAAGLQRHIRDEEGNRMYEADAEDLRSKPSKLLVYGPEPTEQPSDNWLRESFPRLESLHPCTSVLWLTQQALIKQQSSNMEKGFGPCVLIPYDLKDLTDSVYEKGHLFLPENWIKAEKDNDVHYSLTEEGISEFSILDDDSNNTSLHQARDSLSDAAWNDSLRQDTKEKVTVVLAKWQDGELIPYSSQTQQPWAYSMVTIPRRLWETAELSLSEQLNEAVQRLVEKEPSLSWVSIFPITNDVEPIYDTELGWITP